jgi:hypothetical protein
MTIPSFVTHFQWRAVLIAENGSGYEFPSKLTPFLRGRYSIPIVYRWRVHPGDQGKPEELYIGEAEDLARRIQRVLTPGADGKKKSTNARLREQLDMRRADGKHVYLDYLDFAPFELNDVLFTKELLREVFLRRAMENLSLYLAQVAGHELLNFRVDHVEKVSRELAKFPPHIVRKALEIAQKKRAETNAETH